MRTLAELIDSNPEVCDFWGPIDEFLVIKAEASLGVKFPLDYRQFLLAFGSGSFDSFEIYGLSDSIESKGVPNLVWLTLNEWDSRGGERLLIIGDSGDGGYFVLNPESESIFHCPIGGAILPVEKVANSFGEYFALRAAEIGYK